MAEAKVRGKSEMMDAFIHSTVLRVYYTQDTVLEKTKQNKNLAFLGAYYARF